MRRVCAIRLMCRRINLLKRCCERTRTARSRALCERRRLRHAAAILLRQRVDIAPALFESAKPERHRSQPTVPVRPSRTLSHPPPPDHSCRSIPVTASELLFSRMHSFASGCNVFGNRCGAIHNMCDHSCTRERLKPNHLSIYIILFSHEFTVTPSEIAHRYKY